MTCVCVSRRTRLPTPPHHSTFNAQTIDSTDFISSCHSSMTLNASRSVGFSRQGSTHRIFYLHSALFSASSSVTSTTVISSLTASIYLLSDLPRFQFSGRSNLSILIPIYPSSILRTCPNHLSLASLVFSPNRPTCAGPLM